MGCHVVEELSNPVSFHRGGFQSRPRYKRLGSHPLRQQLLNNANIWWDGSISPDSSRSQVFLRREIFPGRQLQNLPLQLTIEGLCLEIPASPKNWELKDGGPSQDSPRTLEASRPRPTGSQTLRLSSRPSKQTSFPGRLGVLPWPSVLCPGAYQRLCLQSFPSHRTQEHKPGEQWASPQWQPETLEVPLREMLALLVVEGKQKMVPADCKDAERESYKSTCQKMKKKRRGRKEEMKNVFKKKKMAPSCSSKAESASKSGEVVPTSLCPWTEPQPTFPLRTEL